MEVIIRKCTYGVSEAPAIEVVDISSFTKKPYLLADFDGNDVKEIFAFIEYCLSQGAEIRVESFRESKEA